MVLISSLFSVALLTGLAIASPAYTKPLAACDSLDIVFTGLPPYHPLVVAQGFNPAAVDAGLRADAAEIIAAGYNLRVVLMGPEQNISVLASQLQGTHWDGAGIGYGVRGSNRQDLTLRLGEIIDLYRHAAPAAPIVFDYSFVSGLWALQERFPLSSNCTNSPGKDLGFEIFCDICGSNSTTNSTSS